MLLRVRPRLCETSTSDALPSFLSVTDAAAMDEARKIGMAKAAALSHDRFTTSIELDPDLRAAVDWIAARDPIQEGVLVSHLVH